MTIDTNELRRLAQAATPGPWYVTGKLTRYVEARIDGGLIQEVAACGPTKADGGYGPQQEANARLLAAANPATISELLGRLEAAEKERDAIAQQLVQSERGKRAISEECDALRNEIAYVKEVEFPRRAQAVADAWKGKCKRLEVERDILCAKIARMERQGPVMWANSSNINSSRINRERGGCGDQHTCSETQTTYHDTQLYALPGAKGE